MIRKALTLLILVSMTLHCANRLGVLSYLYANRADIAVSLGLSTEETIAVCDSNYFQGQTLIIPHDEGHTFPPIAFQNQEINLFLIDVIEITSTDALLIGLTQCSSYHAPHYQSVIPSVFHPPATA